MAIDLGDGVFIGWRDPSDTHHHLRTMTFKTSSKKTSIKLQKSYKPTFTNEYIFEDRLQNHHDNIDENLKEAATVEARTADFTLEGGFSVLTESGINRAEHSIMNGMNLDTFSLFDEVTGVGNDNSGPSTDVDQQLMGAGSAGKGMASSYAAQELWANIGEGLGKVFSSVVGATVGFATTAATTGATGGNVVLGSAVGIAVTDGINSTLGAGIEEFEERQKKHARYSDGYASEEENNKYWVLRQQRQQKREAEKDGVNGCETTDNKPGVDDNNGDAFGDIDPKTAQKLLKELRNFNDPSSTPGPNGEEDVVYDVVTMPDPKRIKDPFTNWGIDGYQDYECIEEVKFVIDSKEVNWGDNYTDIASSPESKESNADPVSDGVQAVEDAF